VRWFNLDSLNRGNWFDDLKKVIESGDSIAIYKSSDIDVSQLELPETTPQQTIAIFSGGTTGAPKLVFHPVSELLSAPKKPSLILGTFYSPDRMAGLQALIHGLKSGNAVFFIDPSGTDLRSEHPGVKKITHLSATPSQMRVFDLRILLAFSELRAITLGGEPVTPKDIAGLKEVLPDLKIYQIYASSEFGQMCSVRDEKPGLPLEYFKDPSPRFNISADGELLYRSHLKSNAQFCPTGDLVSISEGRVYFVGRKDLQVSVGGVLRSPEAIETAIKAWPEVDDCVVKIKTSALMGSILVAEVIANRAHEALAVSDLHKRMMELPPNKQAQMIKQVDRFKLNAAGKVARRYE